MINRISAVLFLFILVELCLGGGGRFTAFGPVSLRMILFALALVISVALLLNRKSIPEAIWRLMIAFALVISIGMGVGWVNQNPKHLVFEDVKPLCFFFILPFFYLTVDEARIAKIAKVIKATSIFMAILFVVLVVLINFGVIPFLDFYKATLSSEELFYRGEATFFYKGFLFFGIGSIFFYFSNKKYLFISILILAIIASVTRGLLFSLALTFSIYFLVTRSYLKAALGFVVVTIILAWGSDIILSASRLFDAEQNNKSYMEANPNLLGDRNYSDNGRIAQAKEVWQRISFSSALIGHGFGAGIPSRPIHMEISYLEIFHKQGLIGMVFWGFLAGMILIHYRQATTSPLADAFFFSALFIFIESTTNQYINNPIGMSMLLLSLVCLDKLKKPQ